MELELVTRRWWSFLLRGLLAIVFGVLVIAYPGASLKTFIVLFGIYAILDGVIDTVYAIVLAARKEKWGLTLAGGLVSLLLGGVVLSHPGIALGVVVLLVAIWAMVAGVVSLASAFEAAPESGRGWVGAIGALQIIVGILILAYPFSSTYALMVVIGVYALAAGGYLIVLALYALSRRNTVKLA